MSDKAQKIDDNFPTIYPTGPGSNPSSFPGFNVSVDPSVGLPGDTPADGEESGDPIRLSDGRKIAPNGDYIVDPSSSTQEILPAHEYTPEKEDLDLLIM
jgi:hypothetical protein